LKRRRSDVFVLWVCAAAISGLWTGCGSPDCTETATCPGGEEGAATEAGRGEASTVPDSTVDSQRDSPVADQGNAPDGIVEDAGEDAGDGSSPEQGDAMAAADADSGDAIAGHADAGDAAADANPSSDAATEGGEAQAACDTNAPDCSNPACAPDFMCTASAPPGWFGPVAFSDQGGGPPPPAPPACTDAYINDAFDANGNPTSPSASCECSCGAAQNACTQPMILVSSDNQCLQANQCGSAGASTCTVACSGGGQSLEVTAQPSATGSGSCAANSVLAGLPAWQWTRTARGCASNRSLATGGCQSGDVCADRPVAPFESNLCVWKNGSTDCSTATGYPLLHNYYGSVTDTRGCSLGSCGCGAPTNVSCTLASVTVYNTNDCSDGGSTASTATDYCTVKPGNSILGVIATVTGSGQCGATGSALSSGNVAPDPSTAVTVCCAQ
jgi:hypothetical protein